MLQSPGPPKLQSAALLKKVLSAITALSRQSEDCPARVVTEKARPLFSYAATSPRAKRAMSAASASPPAAAAMPDCTTLAVAPAAYTPVSYDSAVITVMTARDVQCSSSHTPTQSQTKHRTLVAGVIQKQQQASIRSNAEQR